jgi:hypothetical protein
MAKKVIIGNSRHRESLDFYLGLFCHPEARGWAEGSPEMLKTEMRFSGSSAKGTKFRWSTLAPSN